MTRENNGKTAFIFDMVDEDYEENCAKNSSEDKPLIWNKKEKYEEIYNVFIMKTIISSAIFCNSMRNCVIQQV